MSNLPVTLRAAPEAAAGRSGRAFTLIELLVVVAIMAILAMLLLPVIGNAMKSAASAHCRSNLHQVSAAFMMYVKATDGFMPPSGSPSTAAPYRFPYWYKNLEPFIQGTGVFCCPAKKRAKWGYGLNHMWCGPSQIYGDGAAMWNRTKEFVTVENPSGTLLICDTGVVTNKDDPPDDWQESDAANVNGCVRFPYDNRPGEPGKYTYWHSDPRRPVPRHLGRKTTVLFFDGHGDGIRTAEIVDDLWDEAGCIYDNNGMPKRK
ncbi:MAG TPA: type II secretion system protein [Planctomycetota bacterium]|nr:type II secretion system protein [Planctomycetota bacterium]